MLTPTVTIIHRSQRIFLRGALADIVHNPFRQVGLAVCGEHVDLVLLEGQLDLRAVGDDAGNRAFLDDLGVGAVVELDEVRRVQSEEHAGNHRRVDTLLAVRREHKLLRANRDQHILRRGVAAVVVGGHVAVAEVQRALRVARAERVAAADEVGDKLVCRALIDALGRGDVLNHANQMFRKLSSPDF